MLEQCWFLANSNTTLFSSCPYHHHLCRHWDPAKTFQTKPLALTILLATGRSQPQIPPNATHAPHNPRISLDHSLSSEEYPRSRRHEPTAMNSFAGTLNITEGNVVELHCDQSPSRPLFLFMLRCSTLEQTFISLTFHPINTCLSNRP